MALTENRPRIAKLCNLICLVTLVKHSSSFEDLAVVLSAILMIRAITGKPKPYLIRHGHEADKWKQPIYMILHVRLLRTRIRN